MFKHILVPLDGSRLAEIALSPAASLAKSLNAPVILLHVIEENAPREIHKERHLTQPEEANTYLSGIVQKYFSRKTRVEWHVHEAEVQNVAASIVNHTDELHPDLLVMCAHGRSGVHNFLFGSIAQQVLAQSTTPILLLQPESDTEPQPFQIRRILVPLDIESDDSLPIAEYLAQAYQSELYLLSVIPTLGTLSGEQAAASNLLPGTAAVFLDIKEEHTSQHLQDHLTTLTLAGFNASVEIVRGDPALTIVDVSKRINTDLIVLSTHRRVGMDAFWARSVAPNVVRRTHTPILLVPLPPKGNL
jgi:nucleotide-binding universal stress UspA family protein